MLSYEHALVCPISFDYFKEPVVANDGYTYEKSEIKLWLKKNKTSPITGNSINSVLLPNNIVKNLVTKYKIKNNIIDDDNNITTELSDNIEYESINNENDINDIDITDSIEYTSENSDNIEYTSVNEKDNMNEIIECASINDENDSTDSIIDTFEISDNIEYTSINEKDNMNDNSDDIA